MRRRSLALLVGLALSVGASPAVATNLHVTAVTETAAVALPDGATGTSATANCASGQTVLGGGYSFEFGGVATEQDARSLGVFRSAPVNVGGISGWTVALNNRNSYGSPATIDLVVYALCTTGDLTGP